MMPYSSGFLILVVCVVIEAHFSLGHDEALISHLGNINTAPHTFYLSIFQSICQRICCSGVKYLWLSDFWVDFGLPWSIVTFNGEDLLLNRTLEQSLSLITEDPRATLAIWVSEVNSPSGAALSLPVKVRSSSIPSQCPKMFGGADVGCSLPRWAGGVMCSPRISANQFCHVWVTSVWVGGKFQYRKIVTSWFLPGKLWVNLSKNKN